jgi:hypothetical protein
VWTPGDTLVTDCGSPGSLHVFCAVLAWWVRFVRFAANEKAETGANTQGADLGGHGRVHPLHARRDHRDALVIYLLASLCLVLPSPWKDIGRFSMAFAAYQVTAQHAQAGLLSPWASMLVLVAWPAGALLAAGLMWSGRDA